MNCIIVDDEPQARKLLETYLLAIGGCTVVHSCPNALSAYEVLSARPIDLMFLDIKMPQLSGIDFLKSLSKPPLVVLTTAYNKYALAGYELDVVDYLMKPIALPRLIQSVEKAKMRLMNEHVEKPKRDFVFVKDNGKYIKVAYSAIVYVEGLQNYVKLLLKDGATLVASSTMKAMEEELPSDLFIRIHRSYIVAFSAVQAIKGNVLETTLGELPIGPQYKEELMKRVLK